MKVRAVALRAHAGVSQKCGPVVNVPVGGMLAGVGIDDRLVVRRAASGDRYADSDNGSCHE